VTLDEHEDLGDSVVIVGAGPVGFVCALLLAEQGLDVHLFEREPLATQKTPFSGGRSISLTITERGWPALRRAGVEDRVRAVAMRLTGRMFHLASDETRFQPYGANGEVMDSVSRVDLQRTLSAAASDHDRIHLRTGWRCLGASLDPCRLRMLAPDGRAHVISARRLIAADGANSAVRTSLLADGHVRVSQRYSRYLYKELRVPFRPDGAWPLEPGMLHLWPRGDGMLGAFPNPVTGFACMLLLQLDAGPLSFNALADSQVLAQTFAALYPDLFPLMPGLFVDFYARPPSQLASVRCEPWVVDDLALIGDAVHAMYPFLGQGLNSGLEDSAVLVDCLQNGVPWRTALARYAEARKPNCDAINDLADDTYLLQSQTSPDYLRRRRLELRLGELFPSELRSGYDIAMFTSRSYLEAHAAVRRLTEVVDRLLAHDAIGEAPDEQLVALTRGVLADLGREGKTR
jgi:kynurenine 3-monooxygenase